MNPLLLFRLSGIAGLLAALGWIIGDMLIVGHAADQSQFPLLFEIYAAQIDADFAERLVGISTTRLIAGALFAVFTVPLYLAGTWHLWCGIRSAGRLWAVPAVTLIFIGYALSPLPHAAFYFVGAVYQAILTTDPATHPVLLALADEFHGVLLITYAPAVASQVLGMLAFSLAVATGRSAYPRWFALTSNPLLLGLVVIGGPALLGGVAGEALGSAAFNLAWLLLYAQSLVLLWKPPTASAARNAH